jgi:hypothetical protein
MNKNVNSNVERIDVRVLRDDELDAVVGGVTAAVIHFASFPITGFSAITHFLPLPPSPC